MYIDQLLARLQEHHFLYIFEHRVKVGWYLLDLYGKDGINDTAAVWFPSQRLALAFEHEEEVEDFRSDHLAHRPVSIVKIQRRNMLI